MDTQTAMLTAVISLGGICALILILDGLRKWLIRRLSIIAAKELDDCKPGAFMMTKGQEWEDLE